MSVIKFTVNGKFCKADACLPPYMSLNAYIRYVCGLTGTKAMCREGGCGACIVTVRAKRYPSCKIETFSVNSCLVLVFSCHGWEITTVEGLGNRRNGYSDIQKRLAAFNGTQCGYCTPGWVMHMNSLKDKNLTMAELEKSFGSNTCRCTGFRPILDTIKSFASDTAPELCQLANDIEDVTICAKGCERKCSIESEGSDWSIIENISKSDNSVITLDFGKNKFFKVYNEGQIFEIFKTHGVDSYMLVDGNTGKGIVETFEYPKLLIDISSVQSLKTYELDQNLVLGANLSLEDCITIFKETYCAHSDFTYLTEFVKHFELIAHIPVRKIGSLAGNLMYKRAYPDYQSDVCLLFECVGATITIRTWNNQTTTLTVQKFLKYNMQGCVMKSIELPPYRDQTHTFRSYKIMPRNQNALAIVNAAFLVKLDSRNIVKDTSIVFGNINSNFFHAKLTESYLKGKKLFENATASGAIRVLNNEVKPKYNPPEQSPSCRKKLAVGLFYKFVLNICPSELYDSFYRTGGYLLTREISQGTQDFQTDSSLYPLNKPIQKLEALIQCSGEAKFANDVPAYPDQVFAAFVLSTVHSGEVDKIYKEEILEYEDVIAMYTADDIPGDNSFILPGLQLEVENEEILATTIKYYGQPIAIVVAEDEELVTAVAKKVRVTYKNVNSNPPVLTIDEGKKDSTRFITGDGSIEPTGRGTNVRKIIKGVYEIEGQYHYYMEPLTTVVVPVDNAYEVYDSTQWMDLTQTAVSRCLNISESKVLVKVSRIGGGFGGKITRNGQVAAGCALAAYKLNRPCRLILPMQTNLAIAGKRLPSQCEYEVGVDDDGKIQYLTATINEDVGCSLNDNVTSYTSASFPNCYDASNFTLSTNVVLTDLPGNTFARAPGACEGISSMEHIMEHISFAVQKDPTDVRLANLRSSASDIKEMIETLKTKVDYDKRVAEVKTFNESNRWMKKAIKIVPMDFPVIYYGNYSAYIAVYRGDGTVTITTGGIEMGQGANTKAAQVCARELGIPVDYIQVIPHYSFISANNVFSGSSITTESVCYSIIKACAALNKRLEPIRSRLGVESTWLEVIKVAGEEEIDLTEGYMMNEKEEDLSGYSAYAISIIEVQLSVLTGRFQIVRVDILEDVGISINPILDVGQVEGGFIQGIGYFTCEKLVYDKVTGANLTNRSLKYHVPLCLDIPVIFNVHLRYNSKNSKGVLGAKTCGEMGICTAHGVTLALRECIMASRKDSGYEDKWLDIGLPYETEIILEALDVKLEELNLTPS